MGRAIKNRDVAAPRASGWVLRRQHWQIDYAIDDQTGGFPNPTLGASAPTVFSSMSGSLAATDGAYTTPVATIRLTISALSSMGGMVTATVLQSGIG